MVATTEVHYVLAIAALNLIGHLVAVGLGAGVDGVVAARAHEFVLAVAADDQIVAVAAVEQVGALLAEEPVAAVVAEQEVGVGLAVA